MLLILFVIINRLATLISQVRNEALQIVAIILSDAKFINPQLGELPSALAARNSDSNLHLVQQSLVIGQTLAVAMDPNFKQHVESTLISTGTLSQQGAIFFVLFKVF